MQRVQLRWHDGARLVDVGAGGRLVARDGHRDARPVGQLHNCLDEALAKRGRAGHARAPIVLQRARQHLAHNRMLEVHGKHTALVSVKCTKAHMREPWSGRQALHLRQAGDAGTKAHGPGSCSAELDQGAAARPAARAHL